MLKTRTCILPCKVWIESTTGRSWASKSPRLTSWLSVWYSPSSPRSAPVRWTLLPSPSQRWGKCAESRVCHSHSPPNNGGKNGIEQSGLRALGYPSSLCLWQPPAHNTFDNWPMISFALLVCSLLKSGKWTALQWLTLSQQDTLARGPALPRFIPGEPQVCFWILRRQSEDA